MATTVPDNHDKAHEVMSTEDAMQRGQDLAEQNLAAEQKRDEENRTEADAGFHPEEGKVPEDNDANGNDTGSTTPGDTSETSTTTPVATKKSAKK